MANLIEQQDLLKGLTDDRLSGLLQNPVGDIPPFLVAAEAQRRQAIRQQFAGQDQQESVVDSLTKQLAAVPQNINTSAPAQGIASIPQQAPQQAMNRGGYVQRYAAGTLVVPTADEYYQDPLGVPSPDTSEFDFPSLGDLAYKARLKLEGWKMPEETAVAQVKRPPTEPRDLGMYPNAKPPKVETANEQAPRDPDTSNEDSSYENQSKAQDAALRKRIEAMYASEDKGMLGDPAKWFAMAQAFLQPDTDFLTSAVNAGAAYASGTAEEKQQQRADALAREEALLKWDISERDADLAAAAKLADRRYEEGKTAEQRVFDLKKLGIERGSLSANQTADVYTSMLKGYDSQISDLQKSLADVIDTTERAAVQKQIQDILIKREQVAGILSNLVTSAYGTVPTDVIHLPQ